MKVPMAKAPKMAMGKSPSAPKAAVQKPHIRMRHMKPVAPSAFPASPMAFPPAGAAMPDPTQAMSAPAGGMPTGAAGGDMGT